MRGRKLLNAAVMVGAGVVVGMWMGAPAISAQSGTGTRVAIIDVQRVLARSAAGVAAREQLEKEKAAMQKQVDGQRTELERMRDELEKKGQLLSVEARREKQEALERKVRDVRRLVDDLQASLQKKEEALLAKVLQDLGGLVQKVGKDKGFTMILERQRSGVLYAAPESDVTDDVLKAYDEETKKAKK